MGSGRRPLAWAGVGHLVHRREGERGLELRPSLGRAPAGCGGARGNPPGRGARRVRGRRWGPGRDLPADVAGGAGRVACVRAHRRRAGADLLRLRGTGGGPAATGVGGEGGDHGALVDAPRARGAHARDPRGGAARGAERGARPRRAVGRARRGLARRAAARGARLRGPLPPHVHVRDDRDAEGRRPRPGWLPRLDCARGLLPGRRRARRPDPLRDRHGLDHGPVDRRRGACDGLDARLRRGRARLAGRPAVEADRVGAGIGARYLPHAHPRSDPAGGAADGPLVAPDDRHHRRAVEPRAVSLALRGGRRRALPDHQLLGRDRGRGVLPVADAGHPDQGLLARGPCARDGNGRRRLGGQLRARRGRRARLPQAVPRDDARLLARPRAVLGHLLAAFPRHLDARRLGVRRRGRLLVPARALRRHAEHRRQAGRPRGARVGRCRSPGGGRGGRDRRPARGEGRGGVDLLRPDPGGAGGRCARSRGRRRGHGRTGQGVQA